jgi:hypothetical protein
VNCEVQSRAVSKSPVNPIINPNPVYSHTPYTWRYWCVWEYKFILLSLPWMLFYFSSLFPSWCMALLEIELEWDTLSRVRWLWTGFRLVVGFIEHLEIVTTSNYSAIANSHTLQFTTARTKPSQSVLSLPVVAWWRIQQCPLIPCSRTYRLATVPHLTHCFNCPAYNLSARTA